jgi:type IV pilus assembly protein PilA
MAIPALQETTLKKQVKEGIVMGDIARKGVQIAYALTGEMPANNEKAGVPPREKMVGNLVKDVNVDAGAITLTFGNNASAVLDGKKLTLLPAIVDGQQAVPIAWLCNTLPVPKGMEAKGKNETDIPEKYLPLECRDTTKK